MNKVISLTVLALLLSGCRITTTIVGQGTVTSQSGSFNCATGNVGACTKGYATAGSEVFTAIPAPGWTFAKWTNCSYISITSCGTSFGQNTAADNWPITATFKLINPPVQAATYTYNALGQRITKKAGGVTTIFQYDLEGNLMAELNSSGQALRQHITIDGEPIAQVSTTPASGAIAVHYVHTDHLGTPTLLTNQSGNVIGDIEAMPFGETFVDYAEVQYNKRFPGQYKDAETGLHYNYFRDYDPSTGRYVQSDPIGLGGGVNTYAYVGGNPFKYTDPYGLDILLQTHPVAFGFDHAKLTIIPNNQAAWVNDPRFSNSLHDSRKYLTLGAGSEGGDLVSNLNRSRDINLTHNQTSSLCRVPTPYATEDDLIESLLDADQKYRDNFDYEYFPQSFTDGYNSNSYLSGLLRAAGIDMPSPLSTPGFAKPLPVRSFR